MPSLDKKNLNKIKYLYYEKKFSMKDIAQHFHVSIDAVTYFMRKHDLKRRSFTDSNLALFEGKKPSFRMSTNASKKCNELRIAGAMLYWAEGYKAAKAQGIDFANSDPAMIKVFMEFLRKVCGIDESRLRVLLYCYEGQNRKKLMAFWNKVTGIPLAQFSKPYVKKSAGIGLRKMTNGMIHVRYADKKLLFEVMRMIRIHVSKYASIV